MDSLTINMIFGYQYTKVQNCEYVPFDSGVNENYFASRDKDNTSNVIPPLEPPLEVHVDVINNAACYHNNGGEGDGTDVAQQTKDKSPGSPTSSRSVNFIGEEIHSNYSRSRRYKRQSLSVGDKINEHAEHHLERGMSVRSYTEEDCSIDMGGRVDRAHTLTSHLQDAAYCGNPHCTSRCSCLPYDIMRKSASCSPADLTQVESDRPTLHQLYPKRRLTVTSSSEASTDTVSPDTPTDSTQEGRGWGSRSDALSDTECTHDGRAWSEQLSDAGSDEPLRSVRRAPSCELAIQQGRLSPQMA